jgi:hypothetical protein
MGKLMTAKTPQAKPKRFGQSFPVSGEADDKAPRTQKLVEGGYGTIKSSRPKESAIVKKSRAQLIQRLGILPRKSK